jgi:hypothetical protein
MMYCSKQNKPTKSIKLYYEQLLDAMPSLVLGNLPRPPSTDTEAMRLSSGIPAVTGRKQAKGRSKKRDRAGCDGGGGDE